ncbi:universal stress protein [Natronococcus sp. JC468]|uniref:universal stress protein n=1 Tax=Natronococcus sp. JC468 TaxID=1961921 RepID=UPI00143B418E|nr:universal stress protein [Natronococcus sp. JC468]NKE34576.1 universal stress protein [Natronococcus sp. JC468]
MTSHLLVPMDDSGPARAALEYALERFPDDEFTVVHAVDDLEAGYAGEPSAAATEDRRPDVFEDARAIAEERDRRIETRVLEGQAAEAILEHVAEADVDGIVMGSEGKSGVSRMLLGSVAEQVARRSPVPVTIVPTRS